jgi:hypothetical protein
MRVRARSLLCAVGLLVGWEVVVRPLAVDPIQGLSAQVADANPELARMFTEDQGDRRPQAGRGIDWTVVQERDKARLARVRELYRQDQFRAGADYYHAAMILQHGGQPSDYLLAHELCVVAIAKGEERAKWLAAASEDRFLGSIGRSQRFGTQYNSSGPNAPYRLAPVEDGVTDALRREYKAPTLEQAKAREAEFNK